VSGDVALARLVAIHDALGRIWDRLDRLAGLSARQIALLHSFSRQLHRACLLTARQMTALDGIEHLSITRRNR
jgi:hypothetical protein